ncbi:MAG: hypothetical protein K0Q70_1639 [Rhodospirillales bacterium]|jgi:hypothetical protein|nr:hypothetical protein [Rhodospirillales bacterium]
MPTSKIVFHCAISAAITYGVFIGIDQLATMGLPETVALLIPGIVFFLALDKAVGRKVPPIWWFVMGIVITGGWYLAFQTAVRVEQPLYIAGAAGGAIGGAAVFLALLVHPYWRTWRTGAWLIADGAAIGALCLPAGFLFGMTDGLDYLFLTFAPWQIGMGLIIARLMQDQETVVPI